MLSKRSFLAGAAATGLVSCGQRPATGTGEEPILNLFNWDTYLGENTLAGFQKATGIRVRLSHYSSEAELFTKVRQGRSGYDVIVPDNANIEIMSKAGLLLLLDHTKVPNFANIAPEYRDADFDPGRKWSMPYTVVVTGIGYRKSAMPPGFVPDSWKWLFDSDRFKGRVAVPGDASYLCRIMSMYLGVGPNAITPQVLDRIETLLTKQVRDGVIVRFHNDDGQEMLLNGEVDLVAEANGDVAQTITADGDIGFVVPNEGGLVNDGCLSIPVDAPHPGNAHTFLNYVLGAEAGADIARTILYATPNAAARALMSPDYSRNPVIYPPTELMARCRRSKYTSPERLTLYEEVLARARAT